MARKWCRLAEEETWEGMERSLNDYVVPLSQVTSFKYLRRLIEAEDDN